MDCPLRKHGVYMCFKYVDKCHGLFRIAEPVKLECNTRIHWRVHRYGISASNNGTVITYGHSQNPSSGRSSIIVFICVSNADLLAVRTVSWLSMETHSSASSVLSGHGRKYHRADLCGQLISFSSSACSCCPYSSLVAYHAYFHKYLYHTAWTIPLINERTLVRKIFLRNTHMSLF